MAVTAEQAFTVFNLCEGILWALIGVGFLVVLCRRREDAVLMSVLAILFLTFGVSDWGEIHTGGWYKPWWMLAWKAANLVGLGVALLIFQKRDRKRRSDEA